SLLMTNEAAMTSPIVRLSYFGQIPCNDNLARTLLHDGGLKHLINEDGIKGVTSNPTIFEKAMGTGDAYDDGLRACASDGLSIEDTYWHLVTEDVAAAADLLRPAYDASDRTDGFVSVEVSPDLAPDTPGT